MSVFQLGPIIRNRREELHLSQEDLADGICSVPTLSRIENGERMPTKNHFEMLMQRLGYSAMSLDYFTDKQDFLIHELKFKIRHAYIEENYSLAKDCLATLIDTLSDPTPTDSQFVQLYDALLAQSSHADGKRLSMLEAALLLTCPSYNRNHIPRILSYEEIIILNSIAICYGALGQENSAIYILQALANYYDFHIVNSEEALRTQIMVLYNLSKYLGLSGKYDDCIDVCNKGISIARNTGRCLHLGKLLFNCSWALMQRNGETDIKTAKQMLKQAYCSAVSMNNNQEMAFYKGYFIEHFNEELLV